MGEEFRSGWSLNDPGQLSPFATRPWFATQWTLEVVASYVEEHLGLAGVAWMAGVGVVVLGLVLFFACRRESAPLPAALTSLLALVGASASLTQRPQLASFVLLTVTVAAWLETERDVKARWWLVPVSWLWAATHGMWFTGVLVGLLVSVGLIVERRVDLRQGVRLLAVPVASVVAAALTPVGPKLLFASAHTSAMSRFVTEWEQPDFTKPAPAVTALMLGLVVLTWARCPERVSWPRLLLLAGAAGWTVYSARTVALGAVMIAPLLAAAMQRWTGAAKVARVTASERSLVIVGTAVCVAALTLTAPRVSASADPQAVPTKLNATLADLPDGSIVYNAYELGGWLEFEHRHLTPVIDPMLDAYSVEYVSDVYGSLHLAEGWETFIEQSRAEYALLPPDGPLALDLEEHLGWRRIGEDAVAGYVLLDASTAKAPSGG